jgi:hypothetical protein
MGAAAIVNLVLILLNSVLSAAKVGGVPTDVIGNIEAAITNLLKVQGTDVTYSQLESLRVKTEW